MKLLCCLFTGADDKQFSILNKLIQIKKPTLHEINKQNFDDFGNSIKEKLRLKRRVLGNVENNFLNQGK